jgi:hypothetical protein
MQQEFLLAVGAVDIAGTQLGGQTVAFAVEQQQRMITGGLEVAVVSTLLLPAMDPDFEARERVPCSPNSRSHEIEDNRDTAKSP